MIARLIFITGSRAGTAVDLGERDHTIGRGADRTIAFGPQEILVSTRHASIAYGLGEYVLRDDASRNGTFVNGDRLKGERPLGDGDVIQFGPGGPAAKFVRDAEPGAARTLDPAELSAALELIERTARKTPHARDTVAADAVFAGPSTEATRRRRRWEIAALLAVVGVGALAVVAWQQRREARFEHALVELAVALADERSSRGVLEQNLAAVGARYDSLQLAVDRARESVARDPRVDASVVRNYSRGVALLVFAYGFGEGNQLLRYAADGDGQIVTTPGPGGRAVPSVMLGGAGPPVRREGTATGFLIDSTGWLVTNRHVARPWEDDPGLDALRESGFKVSGRLLELRAYFPPGDQSAPLVVEKVSANADAALLRVLGNGVSVPVLPLGPQTTTPRPGDQLISIGYPTGPFNLLFRVNERDRLAIVERVGDNQGRLVAELARRRLIQPLITSGSVSDTTASEVIHTAATTVGGSGGPLVDADLRVAAVQYAILTAPNPGDPFRTQRAVPVRYVWDILPPEVRNRLRNVAGDSAGQ
jgi:S1-C subfamily serine protease